MLSCHHYLIYSMLNITFHQGEGKALIYDDLKNYFFKNSNLRLHLSYPHRKVMNIVDLKNTSLMH